MNDPALAESLARAVVSADEALEQEFEARLRDSGTLAFRVAYGVLRHREDAEDVAQESLAKAYRCFRQLRNRERFRSWLVRTTWRMALDWRRGDRRRTAREQAAVEPAPACTETVAAERERAAHLWTAIDALPTSCASSSCSRASRGTIRARWPRCSGSLKARRGRDCSWRGKRLRRSCNG